jgi:hypothetical protein
LHDRSRPSLDPLRIVRDDTSRASNHLGAHLSTRTLIGEERGTQIVDGHVESSRTIRKMTRSHEVGAGVVRGRSA